MVSSLLELEKKKKKKKGRVLETLRGGGNGEHIKREKALVE